MVSSFVYIYLRGFFLDFTQVVNLNSLLLELPAAASVVDSPFIHKARDHKTAIRFFVLWPILVVHKLWFVVPQGTLKAFKGPRETFELCKL